MRGAAFQERGLKKMRAGGERGLKMIAKPSLS